MVRPFEAHRVPDDIALPGTSGFFDIQSTFGAVQRGITDDTVAVGFRAVGLYIYHNASISTFY
jgi:hypothetical protein